MSITTEQLTAEVLRLADVSPDAYYVGPDSGRCMYTAGRAAGACGCLFGQALTNLGVPYSDLLTADRRKEGITDVARRLGITHGTPAIVVSWCEVQDLQDSGMPWSDAVAPLRGAL